MELAEHGQVKQIADMEFASNPVCEQAKLMFERWHESDVQDTFPETMVSLFNLRCC